MSGKVIFVCGHLSGRLSIALLAALIKSRPAGEVETLLVQLEEPIVPPVFSLSAPLDNYDDELLQIKPTDHSAHSLRSQRKGCRARNNSPSWCIRSRRTQSMTRPGKRKN